MLSMSSSGDFAKTEKFLRVLMSKTIYARLEESAKRGVVALENATPVDTGLAQRSWGYRIERTVRGVSIVWTNSDLESGFPVALRLQTGYGTGTGGYVSGRDYINPAMKPVFDAIAEDVWKAVTSA